MAFFVINGAFVDDQILTSKAPRYRAGNGRLFVVSLKNKHCITRLLNCEKILIGSINASAGSGKKLHYGIRSVFGLDTVLTLFYILYLTASI
jgi:hypothetical protein